MKREEILRQLGELLGEITDDDSLQLTEAMTAADVPEWDSLIHVRFIIAVEQYFGIRFQAREIETAVNVAAVVDMIERKLLQKRA